MSLLKLSYFADNKGRNELTRLIFAVGGIDCQDDLVNYSQYTAMRDAGLLPWGQLPTLTISSSQSDENGVIVGQSCSIARYAARRAGLYPKDEIDALRSDEVVDSWRDFLDLYYDVFFDRKVLGGRMMMVPRKPIDRTLRFKVLWNAELSQQFERYEKLLAKNDGQVFATSKVSFPCWADLAIYDIAKTMEGAMTSENFAGIMESNPNIKKLMQKTEALEAIQKHLKNHPYNDTSSFFASVSIGQRVLHALLFPVINLVLSLKSRYSMMIQPKQKSV